MKNDFCQVYLTCEDSVEATKISEVLLEKRLVACAKQTSVSSSFHWEGKIDYSDEVLLIMDSREDLFDKIEAEVAKLHSYDTFVLQAIPIIKISQKSQNWLGQTLKN